MSQKEFVTKFFNDGMCVRNTHEHFIPHMSSEAFQTAQSKGLTQANAAIYEATDIISALNRTCSIPAQTYLQRWDEFKIKSDFPAALGVVSAVPGRSLLHVQVQFLSPLVTFLVSVCSVAHARASAPSRKYRKISQEMCAMVVDLRARVKGIREFMSMAMVAISPKTRRPRQSSRWSRRGDNISLGIRLVTSPLMDTLKAAENVVTPIAGDWEEDAEMFMKMLDSWMAPDWQDNHDELLQPKNSAMFDVILKVSYVKVGKRAAVVEQLASALQVCERRRSFVQSRVHAEVARRG